jgi:hypothetical protein
MLPFTQAQLIDVFVGYNAAVWPFQLFALLAGIAALVAVCHPREMLQRTVWVILGSLWLWTGGVFFFMHYSKLGVAGPVMGLPFMLNGCLCLLLGLSEGWNIQSVSAGRTALGLVLVAAAMLLHPLLGLATGLSLVELPAFGITPCPLVIFTFGIYLLSPLRAPRWVLLVPTLWALVGGSAPLLLGITADWLLPLSAAAALAVLLPRARRTSGASPPLPRQISASI